MKKVLFLFWLFSTFLLYGQEVSVKVDENAIVGTNFLTGTDIIGETHTFAYNNSFAIYSLNIDTAIYDFTIQLRETSYNKRQDRTYWSSWGQLLRYNCKDQKIKWKKSINYNLDHLKIFNKFIFLTNKKTYQFDSETGKELQRINYNYYFTDKTYNAFFGYATYYTIFEGFVPTSDFCAVDVSENKRLWQRKIPNTRWDDFFYLNDSTVMIVAGGLHTVNLKTGKGFDYNTRTGDGKMGRGAISNIIMDSNYIYVSAMEQIAKLNRNTGAIVWNNTFKPKEGSKSVIFTDDSLIYLINSGYAYQYGYNDIRCNFGMPFIAAYSKNTGQQKYIVYFHRIEMILNFRRLEDNNLFLLLRKRLIHFNLQTGTIVAEREWDDKRWGEFLYVLNNRTYIADNETFENLTSDTTRIFALTKHGEIMSIDQDLDYQSVHDYNKLTVSYLSEKSYKFIAYKNKTYIINKKGTTIAEIEANENSVLIDKTLYNFKNNTVSIIDLTDILVEDTQ